jgi:hypothetical protein
MLDASGVVAGIGTDVENQLPGEPGRHGPQEPLLREAKMMTPGVIDGHSIYAERKIINTPIECCSFRPVHHPQKRVSQTPYKASKRIIPPARRQNRRTIIIAIHGKPSDFTGKDI